MGGIELTCEVCGAPAESTGRTFALKGVGTKGQDIIVWFERRLCAAGHRYQAELMEEDLDAE